jgi:hypothetical protein
VPYQINHVLNSGDVLALSLRRAGGLPGINWLDASGYSGGILFVRGGDTSSWGSLPGFDSAFRTWVDPEVLAQVSEPGSVLLLGIGLAVVICQKMPTAPKQSLRRRLRRAPFTKRLLHTAAADWPNDYPATDIRIRHCLRRPCWLGWP